MEFRNLKRQYEYMQSEIDNVVADVLTSGRFIGGSMVSGLESDLAEYVGVKHCISCANGTDALVLGLMAWDIGEGDAVFVPDFTFFSTAEAPAVLGATPIFVDIDAETFNMSAQSLEDAITKVREEGRLIPKAIITVDLFGQPADYGQIKAIAEKYTLKILEDGAQGFGGKIKDELACSFGDISTTSFFPAKPLGCYGDGGAIFTDNDAWAAKISSLKVHGKGSDKYDNIQIGMNSRLDSLQAAILRVKFKHFADEVRIANIQARKYDEYLRGFCTPVTLPGYTSSWAQYTLKFTNEQERNDVQRYLKEKDIPAMIYYRKPLHLQKAFTDVPVYTSLEVTKQICTQVLSLPFGPYITDEELGTVAEALKGF